jgi:hypothetical protein
MFGSPKELIIVVAVIVVAGLLAGVAGVYVSKLQLTWRPLLKKTPVMVA